MEYLWFGALFVFQGIIMCLPGQHPVVVGLGLASLLGSIYFFLLAWDTGKQRKILLHGPVENRPAPRFQGASPRSGRNERRGLRFLVLACVITFLLILLFG